MVSDTLRRDYLGCYGNNWIHTEYLDKFAKESIVFDRAYISSFPTIPHRRDLFTGRYAFTYSRWISDGSGPNLPRNEIILSQLLKQAGYTTMIIADTYHLFRDCHNFDRGFDGWRWIRGQEHDRYMTNPTDDPEVRQRIMDPQYLQNVSLRRFEEDYFVAQTMRSAIKWLELNYNRHKKILSSCRHF
ncbi:sulfatase-like hydrolase/transferase [Candidatus Bathyarchaeota archaeon]|nr:sulfatase-like hydrolase/transferase [Candidatus Bathyarchaeota archaeon]